MAFNISLNNRISAIIAGWEGIEAKRMFGGICHLINGHMFGGVYQDFLILRLGKAEADQALKLPFVRPLDITGKPLKGWVMVAPEGWPTDTELGTWLQKAKTFALSLPPK